MPPESKKIGICRNEMEVILYFFVKDIYLLALIIWVEKKEIFCISIETRLDINYTREEKKIIKVEHYCFARFSTMKSHLACALCLRENFHLIFCFLLFFSMLLLFLADGFYEFFLISSSTSLHYIIYERKIVQFFSSSSYSLTLSDIYLIIRAI